MMQGRHNLPSTDLCVLAVYVSWMQLMAPSGGSAETRFLRVIGRLFRIGAVHS